MPRGRANGRAESVIVRVLGVEVLLLTKRDELNVIDSEEMCSLQVKRRGISSFKIITVAICRETGLFGVFGSNFLPRVVDRNVGFSFKGSTFLFWMGTCKSRSFKSDFVLSGKHVGHTCLYHLLCCSVITSTDGYLESI